ncbi:MAG: TolC family protein [Truepera sp.]|nr:TolC family protein [Truepera sp.]
MNRIILPLLVAGGLALAQGQEAPPSLTLETAFQIAPDASADLIAARTEVAAAQRDLDRTLADPLALRVPRLQAEQRLASAREALDAALIALRITVARAYFAALEADEALEIARLEHAIAQVSLEAQQVRFNAGAATQLDLDRAGNDLDAAVRTLAETGSDRELAYAELASQLGTGTAVTSLGPLNEASPLPELGGVVAEAQTRNGRVRAAQRAVDLAQAQLDAVDNAFSSRADIESARDRLADTQRDLNETLRTLELDLTSSYNSAVAAQARLDSAQASSATSAEDLAASRIRFDSGNLSPISYEQARLGHARTIASEHSALHAQILAALQLEQAVIGSSGP